MSIKQKIFLIVLIVASISSAHAQSQVAIPVPNPVSKTPVNPPDLSGEVLRINGEFRLVISNNDETRSFTGQVNLCFNFQAENPVFSNFNITVGPQQNVVAAVRPAGGNGDQYLMIAKYPDGKIIIHKIANSKTSFDTTLLVTNNAPTPPPTPTLPPATAAAPNPAATKKGAIKVSPKLTGGSNEHDPFFLVFDISAPDQVFNGSLTIKGKNLDDMKPVGVNGKGSVEFKIPDEYEFQTISYKMTDSRGETVSEGVADLNKLFAGETAAISEITLDKPNYKVGDKAEITIEFLGPAPTGAIIEIKAVEASGRSFFNDRRTEPATSELKPLKITVPLTVSAKGSALLEIKIFDGESKVILDSANTSIIIQ